MGRNVYHPLTRVKPHFTHRADKMPGMGFEEKLRSWMGTKWTPTTLGKRVGVARQTIHNWLDGSSKPNDQAIQLITVKHVSAISHT